MTTAKKAAIKKRLEVKPNERQNEQTIGVVGPATPVAEVQVKQGPVTFLDRLKKYYKGLIALIGFVLILLNQLTPLFDFLPAQDRPYVTAVIGALTVLGTFLKGNENWVDNL